ncbi:MAG: TIGR01777 family protein [Bacteriovoracaceae bacterium]|jgi:uncharacterized protein|nr:TIGR01777 family protein [Bacteriovoracaceae bacterium]
MKILITGATGFIGTRLIEGLIDSNRHDIRILTRNRKKFLGESCFPIEVFEWNVEDSSIESGALENVDTVIHLAGESVADGRWSEVKKRRILESRIKGTALLMDAIGKSSTKPKRFISASAIGIYGNRTEERLNSNSELGNDYLADVCKKWEDGCLNHNIPEMRSLCLRVGIVLGKDGGALEKMLPPFKAGVAGILGSGDQYMSWVHIDDLVGQLIFLLDSKSSNSVYNGVSPRPVSNLVFTKILGRVLKRPTLFPVPGFALKIIFGEMSQILTNSQKVIPENFMNEGYEFKFRSLKNALRDILKYSTKGEKTFKRYQWIKEEPKEVFGFFSNAKNLEKLTPSSLNFKVIGNDIPEIEEGTLIDYKLSLHGIPMKWQSKISHHIKLKSFVDEQIKGPYSKWVHTHDFIPFKGGTLMRDEIVYKIPFGFIGNLFTGVFVKQELRKIFNYRNKTIKQLFV